MTALLLVGTLLVLALFGLALRRELAAIRDAYPDHTDYDAQYRAHLGGTR